MINEINSPHHYQGDGGIEAIDVIYSFFGRDDTLAFCRVNALKYILRAGKKGNTITDIDKAIWYLNKYKEYFL